MQQKCGKQVYSRPELIRYGNIQELTKATTTVVMNANDGGRSTLTKT
jgi:hypothetical protein